MLTTVTASTRPQKSKKPRPVDEAATGGAASGAAINEVANGGGNSGDTIGAEVLPRPLFSGRNLAGAHLQDERTPDLEAEQIGELFFQIGRVFRDVKPKGLKDLDDNLTMAQGRCLWAITKQENCTLRDLSRQLGVSPSTASELVDPLVRAELVQRETDARDRRVVRLRLARKGHTHFVKHKKQRNAHFRVFLDHLTAVQRQTMLDALLTLNDVIQQVEENGKGLD